MEAKLSVYIIEDDTVLAGRIAQYLEKWGYIPICVNDFTDVFTQCVKDAPALLLMDINLPYYDGFYWCRRIREATDVPILFISSRSDDADKIMAIAQGGDDYIEKPFRLELLKAKIEALLRRAYRYRVKERIILCPEVYYEEWACRLLYKGRELILTKLEQRIMSKLVEKQPAIVDREELMTALWDTDEFVSDGALTTLISRLRAKLLTYCGQDIIMTKKGQGYYIECNI